VSEGTYMAVGAYMSPIKAHHVQQRMQRKISMWVCHESNHPRMLWRPSLCSSELASKLKLLEGKLLRGEQRGGLDRLAQEAAAQLSCQQAELRKQQAAEAEAARRIAALEANAQAVQTHTMTLQVGSVDGKSACTRLCADCCRPRSAADKHAKKSPPSLYVVAGRGCCCDGTA